jgi:hypothetical protein
MTETYGQVISEALWCGLPVVALDDSMGVAFQVRDGFDGLLVEPGSGEIRRFVKTIDRVLSTPNLRRELGENAAKRARTRVAPDVIYGRYEESYASAIDHAKRKSLGTRDRKISDLARVMNRHVVPWTMQQAFLATVASFRFKETGTYVVPKVRIDAVPETESSSSVRKSAARNGSNGRPVSISSQASRS